MIVNETKISSPAASNLNVVAERSSDHNVDPRWQLDAGGNVRSNDSPVQNS